MKKKKHITNNMIPLIIVVNNSVHIKHNILPIKMISLNEINPLK